MVFVVIDGGGGRPASAVARAEQVARRERVPARRRVKEPHQRRLSVFIQVSTRVELPSRRYCAARDGDLIGRRGEQLLGPVLEFEEGLGRGSGGLRVGGQGKAEGGGWGEVVAKFHCGEFVASTCEARC